jgi:hypothetical protein
MKPLFAGMVAMLALVLTLGATGAGDKDKKDEKPKYKTSEVMKKAMKNGLAKKVADGNATAAERKQLIDMFVAMHQNIPPKGDRTAWEKITQSLVDAAKAVDDGKDEKAGRSLAKLLNCKACHGTFKAQKS